MTTLEPVTERAWDSFPRTIEHRSHVWITMPDGTRLAAATWMPVDADQDPVPGILEILPYRRADGTHRRDHRNAPYFAGHGYAVVRVDLRGTGDSEGVLHDEYTQTELDDACAVLRWMADQPWCTGRSGIMGISWGGFNGLQVAAMQPPELGAVVSLCSTDDRYADDVHFFGGQLLADNQLAWATTMLGFDARPPSAAVWGDEWREEWRRRLDATPPFIDAWMSHLTRDDFWKHGSVCEDPSSVQTPVLLVSGWADAYRDAVYRMMDELSCPRRGIVGPWAHLWPQFAVPGPRAGFLQEALRWWDRWLKDEPNGAEHGPAMLGYVQDSVRPAGSYDVRPGRWRADATWPSQQTQEQSWWFGADGHLAPAPAADASPVDVPCHQAHGIHGGRYISYGESYSMATDQRPDDDRAATFTSPVLNDDVDVLGTPTAELTLVSDQPEALVSVRVVDVHPDGTGTLVTRGVLNLSHRTSHEYPVALQPGEPVTVSFPLHAIGYRVPAGHRLRIAVSPALWPLVWPSPRNVQLRLDPRTSRVLLPVHEGPDVELDWGPPEVAATEHESVGGTDRGTISTEIGSPRVTVAYEESGGTRLPEGQGGVLSWSEDADRFEIDDDDPTSARAVSERTLVLEQGAWASRVVARAELTCDEHEFHVTTLLRTYDTADGDGTPFFERTWRGSYPRNWT